MGDSPTSPGVTTRSRSKQGSQEQGQGQGWGSPSSTAAAATTPSSSGTGGGVHAHASRSRSGSGSQPGSPRKQQPQPQQQKLIAAESQGQGDGNESESDSDSAGSGRRPVNQQASSPRGGATAASATTTAKSPPSSGRSRPKAEERLGAGAGAAEASNGQQASLPKSGSASPRSVKSQAAQAHIPAAGIVAPQPAADPWWVDAWNYFNGNPMLKFSSLLAFFAFVVWWFYGPAGATTSVTSAAPKPNRQAFFMNSTKLLFKKRFTSQSLDTQLNLLAQGQAMLAAHEPRQPSAIAVLSPPTLSESFTVCFVRKLGKFINEAFDYSEPLVELSAQQMMAADVTRIHTELKSYLDLGGRAVIFQNVDKLAREEYLNFLHAFTDNFRAPSKRTTYYFLLTVPRPLYELRVRLGEWNYAKGGDIAYELLDSAWKNVVSDDKRPAIIARVTPTVVLLEEGDECW